MDAQVPSDEPPRPDSPVVTVDAIVDVLKAIADPTRFQLLSAVAERECGVTQLAELTGAHVASVSQHLAKLRAAGLVATRRDGTRIFYRAASPHVTELLAEAGLVTGYITGVIDPPGGPDGGGSAEPVKQARPAWMLHGRRLRPAPTPGV
jgi:ArsR family transcriptional regulator, lead/cadmium/zinc/bismuth-responsive transcriptional repressor